MDAEDSPTQVTQGEPRRSHDMLIAAALTKAGIAKDIREALDVLSNSDFRNWLRPKLL